MTHMYFSAGTEGRISYGHLGRTSLLLLLLLLLLIGNLILAHNFANVDRFSKFFHLGLSSNCATKKSLQISSHLKRVTTLPCETQAFKSDLISTFIDTSCSLSVVIL